MKKNSRTTNTIFNFTSSIGGQLVTLLMQFVVRTVFINTLGGAYLGIGSLFQNILSMLSLVELGVGSAILYKLYDPIAREDLHRITVLMKFYKTAYQVIGVIIAILGVLMIPLLPTLIRDYDRLAALGLNAVFIFLLYLFKSVSSYWFFAYRSAIIRANQKVYIINLIGYCFTILTGVLQIVSLLIYPNFILYICISFVDTIVKNIIIAVLANRMYPYAFEPCPERIGKNEVKGIVKDCGALLLYKMNDFVIKATDNIVLSAFLGLDMVALYSNYLVLYTSIRTIINKVFSSVTHSLGNLHATDNSRHEYDVFGVTMLIAVILGGTAFVAVAVCADELVRVWIGEQWNIAYPFSLLMGLEIFTLALRTPLSQYRTVMGLFRQGKYRPLAGMIINIVLSVLLVKKWGICGVLVGTIAADWLTFMWFDPLIVHKYGFQGKYPVWNYYRKVLLYFLLSCAMLALDSFLCSHILTGHGLLSLLTHIFICGVTVPLAFLAVSFRSREAAYLLKMTKQYWNKAVRKIRKKRTSVE